MSNYSFKYQNFYEILTSLYHKKHCRYCISFGTVEHIWLNIFVRVWLRYGPCFFSFRDIQRFEFSHSDWIRVPLKRGAPVKARCGVRSEQPTPRGLRDFNHAGRCLLWPFLACFSYRMRYTKNNSLIVVTVIYTCEYQGTALMSLQMYAASVRNGHVWRFNQIKVITSV